MNGSVEKAILAGGCFWGMQDLIRRRPGVLSTRVGYTGGEVPNATYRNHDGHAEAIEIVFDPEQTSYRDVLEFPAAFRVRRYVVIARHRLSFPDVDRRATRPGLSVERASDATWTSFV